MLAKDKKEKIEQDKNNFEKVLKSILNTTSTTITGRLSNSLLKAIALGKILLSNFGEFGLPLNNFYLLEDINDILIDSLIVDKDLKLSLNLKSIRTILEKLEKLEL